MSIKQTLKELSELHKKRTEKEREKLLDDIKKANQTHSEQKG